MWGHGPDDNFSDEVSDFEEKRSSGDESEWEKDDEDSGSEIELDSLPMTPEPSQPSPRDKRDKRPPGKTQLPKPPAKRKCTSLLINITDIEIDQTTVEDVNSRENKRKKTSHIK